MEVRETVPLADAATEDEAVQIIAAMTQLYRENARYLDRIHKWVDRVGVEWVRGQIADLENRGALAGRFDLSQSVYRKDPWSDPEVIGEVAEWQGLPLHLEAAE